MSSAEPGSVISGKVDRISNSGNGILEYRNREFLLGPVKRSAVGETVDARVWDEQYAFCLSKFARGEHYRESFKARTKQILSDPPEDLPYPGDIISASVGSPNSSGHTHGRYKGIPLRVRHIFTADRDPSRKDDGRVKVIRLEEDRIVASALLEIQVRDEFPSEGEEFSAVVAHKSHSGRGLVESFSGGVVNIGPVSDEAVGSEIRAVMLDEMFAYCLSRNMRSADYDEEMKLHLKDNIAKSSKELQGLLTEGATTEREKVGSSSGGYRRDPTFSRNVKEAYNYSCAICGAKRTAPNGSYEVEAAHIYPVSGADEDEIGGGPDDIGNGIALCKMHHWAFDNGWFALTDDYRITVRERPDLPGYSEIKQYDGEKIELPEGNDHHASIEFIRAHRLRIWE